MIVAETLFGPEYADAAQHDLGIVRVVSNTPTDVVLIQDDQKFTLLPPGGYTISYVAGSLMLLDIASVPALVGSEHGVQVRWANPRNWAWTQISFPDVTVVPTTQHARANRQTIAETFYIEFTTPHRLQLLTATRAAGEVQFAISKYTPHFWVTA